MTRPSSFQDHNRLQRDYYEGRSLKENWRMLPDDSRYVQDHVARAIQGGNLASGQRILDVGCGMGKFTIPMVRRGLKVEGLDLSSYLLEQLKRTSDTEIRTHCADLLSPPEAMHAGFDAVSGYFMLHHLPDLARAFTAVAELLRPGGRLVFVDVNPWCPLYYLQIFLSPSMRWRAERGMLQLTSRHLHQALAGAGFTDSRIERYGILPPPLKNRRWGRGFERGFDAIAPLRPIAAFQIITARLPD